MYLFSRQRTMHTSHGGRAMAEAVDIAEMVTDLTGVPVFVWHNQFDPGGGAIVWSARFEQMSDMDEAFGHLMTSDTYAKKVEGLADSFIGTARDQLVQVVAGSLGDKPSTLVSVVSAVAANGHQREAAAWGADLATKVARSLDIPIAFGTSVYGQYGGMGWISAYEDTHELETARGKLAVDTALQAAIDEGGHLVQSDATQFLLRRLN